MDALTLPYPRLRRARPVRLAQLNFALVCALVSGAAVGSQPTDATTATRPAAAVAAAATDPVVTIAGDITGHQRGDFATGALVQRINPIYVLTAGDHAYPDGTPADFQKYDESWAQLKAKTRPTPGNHDYHPPAGSPPYYYTYFADQLPAENGGQYYAFDVGRWRLYSLNCEIPCPASSDQVAWLRDDLATAGAGRHKMAYVHRPRYACGTHSSSTKPDALWDILLAARTDVMVAAHVHNYQRYPRMNSDAAPSDTGMVSFVVGTGGASLNATDAGNEGCALAQFLQSTQFGVLKLTLGANAFTWAFVATDNTVLDTGTQATLDQFESPAPPPAPQPTATRITARAKGHRIAGTVTSATGDRLSGARVTLQRRPVGTSSWSGVSRKRTNVHGVVRTTVNPPRTSYFRWVFKGTADHAATRSNAVRVRR
jgi:hypothetical protein